MNYIIDPFTNHKHSIYSNYGMTLLKKYVVYYQIGGSGNSTTTKASKSKGLGKTAKAVEDVFDEVDVDPENALSIYKTKKAEENYGANNCGVFPIDKKYFVKCVNNKKGLVFMERVNKYLTDFYPKYYKWKNIDDVFLPVNSSNEDKYLIIMDAVSMDLGEHIKIKLQENNDVVNILKYILSRRSDNEQMEKNKTAFLNELLIILNKIIVDVIILHHSLIIKGFEVIDYKKFDNYGVRSDGTLCFIDPEFSVRKIQDSDDFVYNEALLNIHFIWEWFLFGHTLRKYFRKTISVVEKDIGEKIKKLLENTVYVFQREELKVFAFTKKNFENYGVLYVQPFRGNLIRIVRMDSNGKHPYEDGYKQIKEEFNSDIIVKSEDELKAILHIKDPKDDQLNNLKLIREEREDRETQTNTQEQANNKLTEQEKNKFTAPLRLPPLFSETRMRGRFRGGLRRIANMDTRRDKPSATSILPKFR